MFDEDFCMAMGLWETSGVPDNPQVDDVAKTTRLYQRLRLKTTVRAWRSERAVFEGSAFHRVKPPVEERDCTRIPSLVIT